MNCSDIQIRHMAIGDITLCATLQPRLSLDPQVIQDYAEAFLAGDVFPPAIVFTDGQTIWLVDGFHRVRAALTVGIETIEAAIYSGSYRDALLFSSGANATHGLRRTRADKRIAVERLLNDAEWGNWSSREIARHCHVSHTFVDALREKSTPSRKTEVTYRTKHGCKTTMRLSKQTRRVPDAVTNPMGRRDVATSTEALFDRIEVMVAGARDEWKAGNGGKAFGMLASIIALCHQVRDHVFG